MADADDLGPAALSVPRALSSDAIEQRAFSRVRKGLDEKEVRAFLRQVADELAAAEERERALLAQVTELEDRLHHPPLPSRQQLVVAVGEETTRILSSAEAAAQELRGRAEEQAALIAREAQEEASHLREQQLAEAARDAHAGLEAARERGRQMVAEARALRERVLNDLNRRRSAFHGQLEQLRAERDRLVDAYLVVKQTVAQASDALTRLEAANPFEPVATDVGPAPTLAPEPPEPAAVAPRAPVEEPAAPPETEGTAGTPVETAPEAAEGPHEQPAADVDTGVEAVAETEQGRTGQTAEPEPRTEPDDGSATEGASRPRAGARVRTALGLGELPAEIGAREQPRHAERTPTEARSDTGGNGGATSKDAAEPTGRRPSAGAPASVGDVFARIRAGREEAVAQARTVLAESSGPSAESSGKTDDHTTEEFVVVPPVEPTEEEARARDAQLLARRDEVLAPLEHDLGRRAKRALQDEQNTLLDALRRRARNTKPDAALPSIAEQITAWADVLGPAVNDAYAEAHNATVGRRVERAPARIVHALAEVLVMPLRDRLVSALDVTEGAEADNDAIAARISARYREWRSQELEARLGELLGAAYARGVYDAAPEGARLRWVAAEVGRCPDCDDNALEPTVRGECFPTGQQFPPAHPGCRCLLAVADGDVGRRGAAKTRH